MGHACVCAAGRGAEAEVTYALAITSLVIAGGFVVFGTRPAYSALPSLLMGALMFRLAYWHRLTGYYRGAFRSMLPLRLEVFKAGTHRYPPKLRDRWVWYRVVGRLYRRETLLERWLRFRGYRALGMKVRWGDV